jgi:hypothetical protein
MTICELYCFVFLSRIWWSRLPVLCQVLSRNNGSEIRKTFNFYGKFWTATLVTFYLRSLQAQSTWSDCIPMAGGRFTVLKWITKKKWISVRFGMNSNRIISHLTSVSYDTRLRCTTCLMQESLDIVKNKNWKLHPYWKTFSFHYVLFTFVFWMILAVAGIISKICTS